MADPAPSPEAKIVAAVLQEIVDDYGGRVFFPPCLVLKARRAVAAILRERADD